MSKYQIYKLFDRTLNEDKGAYIMFYYTEEIPANINFESAGIFITDQPWQHIERTLDSWLLIFTMEGTLPLEIDGVCQEYGPKELIVIPAGIRHRGSRLISGTVRYLWIHFTCAPLQCIHHTDPGNEDALAVHENTLLLPAHETRINMYDLYAMGQHLIHINQEGANQTYLNTYMNCILYEITRHEYRLMRQSSADRCRMQPIQEWIRVNALEKISAKTIAEHFGYNASYLSRMFKDSTGHSITQEITTCRLNHSKYMLSNTNETIQEIAWASGFNDAKYFMKIFRQTEGMTPSEFRETFHEKHYSTK